MMVIDTIQELVGGVKQDIAPITIFDAVKVSEDSDKTLTDVVKDLSGNRNTFEASKGGYAVILEWFDRNESNENRVGRFVTIDKSTGKLRIADKNDYVYGVVVDSAAYIEKYEDISNNPSKALVCLSGIVSVICKRGYTQKDFEYGKKVIMSEAGYVEKTDSDYGFPVLSVVDDTHLEILMLQNMSEFIKVINKLNDLYDRLSTDLRILIDTNNEILIGQENYPDK